MITVRNCITTVERALMEVLTLAFMQRLPPVADLAALRTAFDVPVLKEGALVHVTTENRVYRWDGFSTAMDDGLEVIAPGNLPAGRTNGRWLRVTSVCNYGPNYNAPLHSRAAGYCREVILYQGDGGPDSDQQWDALFGQRPSLMLTWEGDAPQPMSLKAGALYRSTLSFTIYVVSSCLRPMPAAIWGSPVAAEAGLDPGLNAMIGDVRYVLAGIPLGIEGLEHVELGPATVVAEDLGERIFLASVSFAVRVGFPIPDEDLEPMAMQVTPRLADHPRPRFDPQNYVAQGFLVEPGPGLSRSFDPGIAFIGGAAVASTPAPVTFSPETDTYRDLGPDGAFTYVETALGAEPPPVTPDALRIARTRTTATDIESDLWLCSSSLQYGDPFEVPM